VHGLKHAHTEENVGAVDELVGLLSQEDQTQTHRSTYQISRETGLTQSSVVCWAELFFFRLPKRLFAIIVSCFLRFIFHKSTQRRIYGVVGYVIIKLFKLSTEYASETILKIRQ